MASNMEEEMARFEEEISGGTDDFNHPPMMPPPMFLPHSLQQGSRNNNDFDETEHPDYRYDGSSPPPAQDGNATSNRDSTTENKNFNTQHMGTMGQGNRSFDGDPNLMGSGNQASQQMGPPGAPMAPGPMGSNQMPEHMGPGPGPTSMDPSMNSIGPGSGTMVPPQGNRPSGPGPMGPNSGLMGPRSMGQGPMGLPHVGPGPTGSRPVDRPNFRDRPSMEPPGGAMRPPRMPGFFPPPVLNFGERSNRPTVYSAAPVLRKRVVEEKKEESPASKPKVSKIESRFKPNDEKVKPQKEEVKSTYLRPSSSTNDRQMPQHMVPQLGPQIGPITHGGMPPMMQQPSYGQFGQPPPLYGLSPLAGNPEMAKAAAQATQKRKKVIRTAAGQKWEDTTLLDWDPNGYRIFCGDLGNEVTDDTLARVFSRYSSFQKAKVIREKNSKKSKGYGFVSFKDPSDFIQAMREINGKYVGNRPIKLRKSNWKDRNVDVVRKKVKEKKKLGYKV